MGSISALSDPRERVHVLFGESTVTQYMVDRVREAHKIPASEVIRVENKGDIARMQELLPLSPAESSEWLFLVDLKKVARNSKMLYKIFQDPDLELDNTVVFLAPRYPEFKSTVEAVHRINDLYLSYFRREDAELLLSKWSLDLKLRETVVKEYRSDPKAIVELARLVDRGEGPTSRKEVIEKIGVSLGTMSFQVMNLLKTPLLTEKGNSGRQIAMTQVFAEYTKAYGPVRFQRMLLKSIGEILDVKVLHLSGVIYRRIANLPEGYDEKALKKHTWMLDTITKTPYERILSLKLRFSEDTWYSPEDVLRAVYSWYALDLTRMAGR